MTSLLASCALLAQVVTTTPNTAIFPIDPKQRGSDLLNMFNTLYTKSPYLIANSSEISIQTKNNGLIRQVKKITPSANFTILGINYLPVGSSIQQTIVVFVEQIVEMIYSARPVSTATFTPSTTTGVLPVFSMEMALRASDIVNVVGSLPYKTYNSVSIQTLLNGPFYSNFTNGLIPNVQGVSIVYPTLLVVAYSNPAYSSTSLSYVVVAPDQITAINYSGPVIN